MIFYITLFFTFLYFKIARVHKKEEKMTPLFVIQHILVALFSVALFAYGFTNISWYLVITFSLIFFIMSALMVSAIQLGIFVDGKPILRIGQVYKIMPILTIAIATFTSILWR